MVVKTNNRSSIRPSLTWARRIAPLVFLLGAGLVQLLNPGGSCAVCQTVDDSNTELTRAREKANTTQKTYETLKRLGENGSVGQRVLKRADMQRKIALLDYSSLLKPARREKNSLLRAEVILQFRVEEFAVIQELYRRGSVSKLVYLRAVAAKDIAESVFKAANSSNRTQQQMQAISAANSKYELAQAEFEIATKLFQSNAISQSTLDRATSNLKIATVELEDSKKSLGARAVQIRQ